MDGKFAAQKKNRVNTTEAIENEQLVAWEWDVGVAELVGAAEMVQCQHCRS